jgi:hypothetical protein
MNLKAALVFPAVLAAGHAKDCWAWGTMGPPVGQRHRIPSLRRSLAAAGAGSGGASQ